MASNSFGENFRITTFGESHGKAIGVVIDGCPSGLLLTEEEINQKLALRKPGSNEYVSARKEEDKAEILSGVFEGKTTGAPICILIPNKDANKESYESIKNLYRPGHANFTYLKKYGVYDYLGGGRASARETACRVAAGVVAQKIVEQSGIQIIAYVKSIGNIDSSFIPEGELEKIKKNIYQNPIYCFDENKTIEMQNLIKTVKEEGDSIGGEVGFYIANVPVGFGEPIYQKLESQLAAAMMSIPGSKGFEIGEGFNASKLKGSENNDLMIKEGDRISFKTNHAGGVLAGISNGMPIYGKVAFKPTPSIQKPQQTLTLEGEETILQYPENSRHDPCIAIRAVPVVDAMCAIVLADYI